MRLKNKVSVVAGGCQGIGKAVCLALAQKGSDVLVADIDSRKAHEVSEEIQAMGRKSLYIEMDISNRDQVNAMVKSAMSTFGTIDVLVNVAAIVMKSAIEDLCERDWDRVMGVNLKGTFLSCQAVGREMIRKGSGSIINIGSIAGYGPEIGLGAYSTSKGGVISLTKLMALEWAKYNIRVNCVSPGAIRTPMTDFVYNTEALSEGRARAVPMNRWGKPEEVADAVVFLASDESSFITGQDLIIDGGSMNSYFSLLFQFMQGVKRA